VGRQDPSEGLGKSQTAITESFSLNQIPNQARNLCRLADIHLKSLLLQIVTQETRRKWSP